MRAYRANRTTVSLLKDCWMRAVELEYVEDELRTWSSAKSFVVSVLSFGCWCMTTPLHFSLLLSKRNWKGNKLSLFHTLHTHLISHHAISFTFPAWKKSYVGADFSRPRGSSLSQKKPRWILFQCRLDVFPTAIPTLAYVHSDQYSQKI